MATGDIVRLSIESLFNGETTVVNVFHYRQETELILDTPAEDVIQAWVGGAQPTYLAAISEGNVLQVARAVQLTGAPLTIAEVELTGSGTRAGTGLTPQSSPCISWRTGIAGRRNRGRTYMPPVPQTDNNAGVIGAGLVAALQDFVDDAILIGDGITTADWQLVVWSSITLAGVEVTEGRVPAIFNTQRRRVRGVGV